MVHLSSHLEKQGRNGNTLRDQQHCSDSAGDGKIIILSCAHSFGSSLKVMALSISANSAQSYDQSRGKNSRLGSKCGTLKNPLQTLGLHSCPYTNCGCNLCSLKIWPVHGLSFHWRHLSGHPAPADFKLGAGDLPKMP